MRSITYKESLSLENVQFLDVRSPREFAIDHIPGAINIPLFDDDERIEVGTIYKMIGKEKAILRGTEIVGTKLKDIMNSILPYKEKNIVLSCARGGMRSGSVASLLESLGFSVFRLEKGYKGYRNHVIDTLGSLQLNRPLFVLQGLTGSGKTLVLRKMDNAIDLEGMAGHRSSVFGGIGVERNNQKNFETQILERLKDLEQADYMIIEGESKKIGNLHLPEKLYATMNDSPVILLKTPLKTRVDIIYAEYKGYDELNNIPAIVRSLTSKIGANTVNTLLELLDNKKIHKFIEILLKKYYDPLYAYSLKKKDYLAEIEYTDPENTISRIIEVIYKYLES